ncbi:hypothetical protein [Dechloromonas agitata]|nr:hypothetical protein [Dechloromonas agitata]
MRIGISKTSRELLFPFLEVSRVAVAIGDRTASAVMAFDVER